MKPKFLESTTISQSVVSAVLGGDEDGLAFVTRNEPEVDKLLTSLSKSLVLLEAESMTSSPQPVEPLSAVCVQTLRLTLYKKREEASRELKAKCQALDMMSKELASQWQDALVEKKRDADFKTKMESKVRFYETKFNEYYKQVKMRDNRLLDLGYNASLREESMDKLETDNQRKRQELDAVQKKLQEFEGLDPNDGALVKRVAEIKREILEFDKYFDGRLSV
jgi:septal ring factor EnvC (AmiA/AmiB activator)